MEAEFNSLFFNAVYATDTPCTFNYTELFFSHKQKLGNDITSQKNIFHLKLSK